MLRPLLAAALVALAAPAASQTPAPFASDRPPAEAARRGGEEARDLAVSWVNPPRWMAGYDWGGEALDGSIARGRNFPLGNSTVPESGDVPVEIRLDPAETTLAGRYTLDGGLAWAGTGVVRGSAWDVSNPAAPRRLNLLFLERGGGSASTDGVWNPDASPQGNIELLYVLASSYDGTGLTHANESLADPKPILFGWFARLRPGFTEFQTAPAALRIGFADVAGLTAETAPGAAPGIALAWRYARPEGAAFRVLRRPAAAADDAPWDVRATLPAAARAYTDAGLDPRDRFTYRVDALDAGGAAVHTSREATATAARAWNAELVGTYDGRGGYADVWGYAAPDGREYALGALQGSGLVVVDVSGDVPVEVAFVPQSPGADDSKEVETYGRFAYVVNEVGPIQIVDLADPAAPAVVGQLDTQPGVPQGGSHTHAVVGDRLYVHGGRDPGGVRVYSLADPVRPALLGRYEPFYVHDTGHSPDGRTMYAAAIYGEGVDVVDVTDPAQMTRRALVNYPGSGAHNVCLSADGRTAYVGDEIGGGPWTRIFDVSDPENVELVGEVIVDPGTVVHNCYVRGDRLFLAHYTEGLRVFDIADPHAPVEVAFYDTFAGPSGGFNGAWAVYPWLPSGRVLISDRQGGISVVRLTGVVSAEAGPPAAVGALRVGPNPLGPASAARFRLDAPASARLSVHDVLGRELALLAVGERPAGEHRVRLGGLGLPAGTYVVRLAVDGRPADVALVTVAR